MAAETTVSQPTSDNGTPPAVTSEGSASSSSSSSASSTDTRGREPKTQTVPTSVFKEIKQEHFEKGKREGLAEANRRAQALGYKDYEDMAKTVEAQRASKNGQSGNGGNGRSNSQNRQANGRGNGNGGGNHQNRNRDNRPQPQASSRSSREQRIRDRQARRDQAARDAATAKATEEKTKREQLELQNKELEERLESERAESNLRLLANRCGVQDVDYAIILLKRHVEKMSETDLAAFNDEEYFRTTLKKERPYLYEAHTEPATTGNGTATGTGGESNASVTPPKAAGGETPPPVKTGVARIWTMKTGATVTKTAKELNRQEVMGLGPKDYVDYVNAMGLTHPTMGMASG